MHGLSSGIAWTLQRVKAATQLSIHFEEPSYETSYDVPRLLQELRGAIKASQNLPKLKALVRC